MEIQEVTVEELHEKLHDENPPLLIDVREHYEYDIANLEGMLIPPAELERRLDELEPYKDREIVVYCRSGSRSARACMTLQDYGFENVANLKGGIIEWARKIDPTMPVY